MVDGSTREEPSLQVYSRIAASMALYDIVFLYSRRYGHSILNWSISRLFILHSTPLRLTFLY